jgi:uncharacterized membrane protein YkoI
MFMLTQRRPRNQIGIKMKNKIIVTGILAVAVGVLGLTGCASEKGEQAEMQSRAKITKEQALQTALAKAPGGTVKEGELEQENGKLIWSFDLSTPGTRNTTEVNVDAITGDIVSVSTETPEQEGKEKD